MSKTIVFYKSKFGASKDYAYWLSNTIDCQVFDYSNVTIDNLLEYDTIIFGGGLYTNGINGVSMITKNFKKLKDKKIIIFTVGLSSSNDPDFFNPSLDMLFSKEMQEKIIFFHFPLSINNPSLGYLNNLMLKLFKYIVNKNDLDNLNSPEKTFIKVYGHKFDFTNEHILTRLQDIENSTD
ncbi:MAG: flavodoxin domain-containing protein [Clostridium sp.]|nr:flavodoxin domain-containing protein [Clostridium sp.]